MSLFTTEWFAFKSIAGPAVVRVGSLVLVQNVVEAVFEPAEAESRTVFVSFSGVVVDYVENHFDACTMQLFHHGSKLIQAAKRVSAGAVGQDEEQKRISDRIPSSW